MFPALRSTTFLMSAVALSLMTARAGSLYVAPDGDNNNPGTIQRPVATINHAFEIAGPGDTIFVRGGVYNQLVETQRDGRAGAPITITGFPGEIACVDGTGVTGGRNGFIVVHSYVTIRDLKVRNWPDAGIWIQPNVGFLIIRHCEVYDCGSGIDLFQGVHDFVVDSVDIHHFREESSGFDATSHDGTPIYNGLVSNSKSHDGGGGNCDGFGLGHAGGYGSFQDVHDVRFVNCEAYNIGDGFDISGRDITLERCVAHDTYYGGNYKLWATNPTLINCIGYNGGANVELDVGESPPVTARLINCTFYNGTVNNIWIQTDSCRLSMFNCVLAGGDNVGIRSEEVFRPGIYTGDNNLFHCGQAYRMFADPIVDISLDDFQSGAWTALTGEDSGSRVAFDAQRVFIDTNGATINLRLRAGAAAIDGGRTIPGLTPTTDFDGRLRSDGRIDIGAFEFQGEAGTHAPRDLNPTSSSMRLVPEPLVDRGRIRIDIVKQGRLRLNVYDGIGRFVARLFDGLADSGTLELPIDASGLAPGVYTVVADCETARSSTRFTVIR